MDIIGHEVGRYHIIEQLGQGGMATVFKAFDTRLERDVAIKFIRRDAFSPETFAKVLIRFDREAKALARLSHPNIVKVHDYGEYDGSPYLVMEYILGGALKTNLIAPLPYREAAAQLIPVARALGYAHEHKIIHRDIKPANILLTEDGSPMLTDFGIAKILEQDETSPLTGTGVGIGTPEYMSPEQGMGRNVDHHTDIYSLGVVLYELVTGRKPFRADTPMAVVLKHMTEPLPRPRSIVPGLPDSVEQIIFKALAKKPEDRYPTMNAFAAALEDLAAGRQPENTILDQDLQAVKTLPQPRPKSVASQQTFSAPQPSFSAPFFSPPQPVQHTSVRRDQPIRKKKGMSVIGMLLVSAGVVMFIGIALGAIGFAFYLRNQQTQDRMGAAVSQTQTAMAVRGSQKVTVTPQVIPSATPDSTNETQVTNTPTLLSSSTPSPSDGSALCNQAEFVSDVTVPDGTEFHPNEAFVKTWRLKNTGTCKWTAGYQVVFESGDQMGGPQTKTLSSPDIAPGGTLDISVNLTAPSSIGSYRGNWRLRSQDGFIFGIGKNPGNAFYLDIKVVSPLSPSYTPTSSTPTLPDLLITDIAWAPDPPINGANTHVKVTVYNQGNAAATNFLVRWWGLESFANTSCQWTVANLVAHGGYVLECDFTFASPYAPLNTTAHVDDGNSVLESDEGNNTYKEVIDVN